MKEDRIVLKMTKADREEWDKRIESYKHIIKTLKARLKDEYPDPDDESFFDWEEFAAMVKSNGKIYWLDLPNDLVARLKLREGIWVKGKLAVMDAETEAEKSKKVDQKMAQFIKALSESTVRI